MSPAVVVGIGVLGGVGAIARFAVAGEVGQRRPHTFPLGILLVNLSGAFVLGVLVGLGPSADALRLVGTGFIGSFTTFSTWMLDSHRLAEDGEHGWAALNVVMSLAVGLGVAALGRHLGGLM